MNRIVITIIVLILSLSIGFFLNYWTNTQPIWIVDTVIDPTEFRSLPTRNKQVIELLKNSGSKLATNYKDVVCTEFIIKVIDNFNPLTKTEKNGIRILTTGDLKKLIESESVLIKGLQTALLNGNKGIEIKIEEVQAGDFVQFWNVYNGKAYGHCGVVLDISPFKTITLYSSHPLTNGFGTQTYLWPDKSYFVRLQ